MEFLWKLFQNLKPLETRKWGNTCLEIGIRTKLTFSDQQTIMKLSGFYRLFLPEQKWFSFRVHEYIVLLLGTDPNWFNRTDLMKIH